ncbi:hypothetical protein FB45DRAFT_230356 [Roridomyces roridus]|uniref:F-box domain-containing protein n=1 Tax=Roridomyces roridus TaxID=1738132 RepID=A0AAD7BCF2_9AGAR|nr:hypothetical protein FB45DRAFT_230356 [Roridomyces roridus]
MESPWALPFQSEDVIPEPSHTRRPFPPWNLDVLNYVTLYTWKSLRLPKSHHTEDLSRFPAMHIDIVLEVLSHLHPLDLLSISSTCRSFRDLLLSPASDTIWRDSFSHDGTDRLRPPPPPKSMSSARGWAALIYGQNICDECGAPGPCADYSLWRRTCRRKCLSPQLHTEIPGYPRGHEIYRLIPRTGISNPPRFFPADGIDVLEERSTCSGVSYFA